MTPNGSPPRPTPRPLTEDLGDQIKAALKDMQPRPFVRSDIQAGSILALMQFACAVAAGLHLAERYPEEHRPAEHTLALVEACREPLGEPEDPSDVAQKALLDILAALLRGGNPLR